MNSDKKIIITDTNIITDLSNCMLLDRFAKLDNVYVCSVCKTDEFNEKTGDKKIIDKLKTIIVTMDELLEAQKEFRGGAKLSLYDCINYVVARDNNGILATGDKRLKQYAENHGVPVIRTLTIIKMLKEKDMITSKEVVDACILLKSNLETFIPYELIDEFIKEYENELVNE